MPIFINILSLRDIKKKGSLFIYRYIVPTGLDTENLLFQYPVGMSYRRIIKAKTPKSGRDDISKSSNLIC